MFELWDLIGTALANMLDGLNISMIPGTALAQHLMASIMDYLDRGVSDA